MPSLRFSFAAVVACFLLIAGPAQAARTLPVGSKTDRPVTTARRSATAQPGVAAKAATLAGSKAALRPTAPAAATLLQPAANPPVVAAAPKMVCLAGIVFDKEGRPCPGVCVFPSSNPHQIAVTDAQGNFQLQVPAQASLSIQADYFGLGSSRMAISSLTPQPVHIVLGR